MMTLVPPMRCAPCHNWPKFFMLKYGVKVVKIAVGKGRQNHRVINLLQGQ